MNAKILKTHPLSGNFDELYFDAYDETTCVKFEDHNYIEYCGIFGGGFGSHSGLTVSDDRAFIISFGQGYLFNIKKRELIHKTNEDQLVDVLVTDLNNYFIACSQIQLFVYNNSNLIWSSSRISADGIELCSLRDGLLYGKVYDFNKWVDFTFNLDTFEYLCEWQCDL